MIKYYTYNSPGNVVRVSATVDLEFLKLMGNGFC